MSAVVLRSIVDTFRAGAVANAAHTQNSVSAEVFRGALQKAAIGLIVALIIVRVALATSNYSDQGPFVRPFIDMDSIWIVFAALSLLLLRSIALPDALSDFAATAVRWPRLVVLTLTLIVGLIGWWGASAVMQNFHHSRDEQMAAMDALIFANGQLFAPVSVEWREYATALQVNFTLFAKGNTHWASHYFPVNAAFRSLLVRIGAPDLAAPVLAAASVWLAFAAAKKLWPGRIDAAIVAAVFTAVSAQTIMTAMTPFAMTMHMVLTLLWLNFWLRDDAYGHSGAIITGIFATGIHQVAFHLVFVAPFILSLLVSRRYRLLAVYSICYGGIGLLWLGYWSHAARLTGIELQIVSGSGIADMAGRIFALLAAIPLDGVITMPLQVLKFFGWQHILFAPLVLVAAQRWTAWPSTLRLASVSVIPLFVLLFLLVPNQWFGWGYRYLHGYIGVAALIAAFSWIQISGELLSAKWRQGANVLVATTALTACIVIPGYAYQVRAFLSPDVEAYRAVTRADADIVIIDAFTARHHIDFVQNDPYLRNNPKLMLIEHLSQQQIAKLCANKRVAFFGAAHIKAFGFQNFDSVHYPDIDAELKMRRGWMKDLGCGPDMPLPVR